MVRLFGTNGVRGVINQDMNVELALNVGRAIGTFMVGRVAIATDSRTSGDLMRSAVSAGITSAGSSVVELGMLPTPALQYYVKNSGVKGGVMITASHNPPEFNGIKCVDHDGTEMPRVKEEVIERIYDERSYALPDWRSVGTISRMDGIGSSYANAVRRLVDRGKISEAGLNVVLDCANGAGSVTSPGLLDSLGVRAITLNGNPQGTFPGHPSEPTPDNLKDLMAVVKQEDDAEYYEDQAASLPYVVLGHLLSDDLAQGDLQHRQPEESERSADEDHEGSARFRGQGDHGQLGLITQFHQRHETEGRHEPAPATTVP
jgi:phosphomannomutase/phosphoglucomutase